MSSDYRNIEIRLLEKLPFYGYLAQDKTWTDSIFAARNLLFFFLSGSLNGYIWKTNEM